MRSVVDRVLDGIKIGSYCATIDAASGSMGYFEFCPNAKVNQAGPDLLVWCYCSGGVLERSLLRFEADASDWGFSIALYIVISASGSGDDF